MTPVRVKSLMPILEAYAEGKIIQYCVHGGIWEDFLIPEGSGIGADFDNNQLNWRIKPESREWWIAAYSLGRWDRFKTEQECKADAFSCKPYPEEIIHIKEITT